MLPPSNTPAKVSLILHLLAWLFLMPMVAYLCLSFLVSYQHYRWSRCNYDLKNFPFYSQMKSWDLNVVVYSNMDWVGHYLLAAFFLALKLISYLQAAPTSLQQKSAWDSDRDNSSSSVMIINEGVCWLIDWLICKPLAWGGATKRGISALWWFALLPSFQENSY